MKPRPRVGDWVEFHLNGVRVGRVVGVAVTGAHFLVKLSENRHRRVGITKIIRILPGPR